MRKYIFEKNTHLTSGEMAQLTSVPFPIVRSILKRNRVMPTADAKYDRSCLSLIAEEYAGIRELETIFALARNERRISQRDFIESDMTVPPSQVKRFAGELSISTPHEGDLYTTEEQEAIRRYARFKRSPFAYLLGEGPRPNDFELPEGIELPMRVSA